MGIGPERTPHNIAQPRALAVNPPPHFLVRGRAHSVAGTVAGIGSPENLGKLVFDVDVDLQTAEDIGLMERKIL
jgi:hypothetical protein